MLVQEPVGWILKLSISQFWMTHRKLKSPFQPLKVTGSFEKWAIVSWFPFGLFVVNLLLYNINIEKKTELRQWSYHFQDLEVSFHTDDHVIFFLGYSTKVSFFLSLFFLFFWGIPIPFIPLEWQACYTPNSITPESNFNLLTPKNDKHLISPERITPKSNIKFRRIRDRKLKQLLIVKQILLVNISGNV